MPIGHESRTLCVIPFKIRVWELDAALGRKGEVDIGVLLLKVLLIPVEASPLESTAVHTQARFMLLSVVSPKPLRLGICFIATVNLA